MPKKGYKNSVRLDSYTFKGNSAQGGQLQIILMIVHSEQSAVRTFQAN